MSTDKNVRRILKINVQFLIYLQPTKMGAQKLMDIYGRERWQSSHLMFVLEGVAW